MPAERMNMARTVIVAGLENPDRPSRTVGKAASRSTPRSTSHAEWNNCGMATTVIRIRNAVMSSGNFSVANR